MTVLRIAFAGTPEFAVPSLRALAESSYGLVGVLTQPDRPSGRGRILGASPVKSAALELGIPVAQPHSLKTAEGLAPLLRWQPDLLVVVAYGLLLPSEALHLPRLGCVNIHASLLPRWRGAAPVQRAILAGDAETGVTIMQMDAGLDTGPMLLEKREKILSDDTTASLQRRLASLGASALLEALKDIAAGSIRPRPQPAAGVSYAAKIGKSEALIDWRESALLIERKIRAFYPWPIAQTRFVNEPLKIHSARVQSANGLNHDLDGAEEGGIDSLAQQSGSILAVHEDAIAVRCGEGILEVTRVQRPGRRAVAAADFARAVSVAGQRFG